MIYLVRKVRVDMKNFILYLITCSAVLLVNINVVAQSVKKGGPVTLQRSAVNPSSAKLNINNVTTYVYNNGWMDISTSGKAAYIYIPRGVAKRQYSNRGFCGEAL